MVDRELDEKPAIKYVSLTTKKRGRYRAKINYIDPINNRVLKCAALLDNDINARAQVKNRKLFHAPLENFTFITALRQLFLRSIRKSPLICTFP